MAAVLLTGHGGLDKLEYVEDFPTPVADKGEVLIKVGACGLNNTDINTRTAWYSKKVTEGITNEGGKDGFSNADDREASWGNASLNFPRIQGADVAGRIVAVGSDVADKRIGERVIVDPWLLGFGDWCDPNQSGFFGSECDGGYAQFTKVRSENALKIQSELSDAQLATFPCAYITAENLVARTNLRPGETVVISGASGGVGSAAIQLCKHRGATIIAIASSSKAADLIELGASTVIDRNEQDLEAAIREFARGGVEVALDVVGGAMFMPLINVLRQGGRYSSSGAIAGPTVEFDLRQLIYKDLQMTGATIVPPGTMYRLVKLIESGKLKTMLASSFPLKDLAAAQQAFMAKKHIGNIVVTL